MAQLYDVTNVTNTTNLADLYYNVNAMSGSPWLTVTTVFVFAGFIIILTGLKAWNKLESFVGSSFIFSLITFFLWTANLVADVIFFLFVIFTAMGVFALKLRSN